jgi:hypothetical protein
VSGLRRFVAAVLPTTWTAAMEAESRAWQMRCPCGHETSVWDAGGIRYKAVGNPKRLYRCPRCGLTWHTLYKRTVEHPVSGPMP